MAHSSGLYFKDDYYALTSSHAIILIINDFTTKIIYE